MTDQAPEIARRAEAPTTEGLQNINRELRRDRANMNPASYNAFISRIEKANAADQAKNPNLPTLEFYDSTQKNGPVDSIQARYKDNSVINDGQTAGRDASNAEIRAANNEEFKKNGHGIAFGPSKPRSHR